MGPNRRPLPYLVTTQSSRSLGLERHWLRGGSSWRGEKPWGQDGSGRSERHSPDKSPPGNSPTGRPEAPAPSGAFAAPQHPETEQPGAEQTECRWLRNRGAHADAEIGVVEGVGHGRV